METTDFQQLLAARLRQLREHQGWSLEALAELAGVSRSNISSIERGQSSPTAAVLDRLATALGIPLASLFAGLQSTPSESPCYRHDEQAVWVDPASGYQRRRLTALQGAPLQMVEVTFPAGNVCDTNPCRWPLTGISRSGCWQERCRLQPPKPTGTC